MRRVVEAYPLAIALKPDEAPHAREPVREYRGQQQEFDQREHREGEREMVLPA